MSTEKVSQLPTVSAATLPDVIYAIQNGNSVQETLQQVYNLFASQGNLLTWNLINSGTVMMLPSNGYIIDNGASLVTLTLPSNASYGTLISVVGFSSGGWSIAQNSGQNIQIGNRGSTVGTGGSVSSSNQWDSLTIVNVSPNTIWSAYGGPQGNLTIV